MTLAEQYLQAEMEKTAGTIGGSFGERFKSRAKLILGGGKNESERVMNLGRGGAGKSGPVSARHQQMSDNFLQRGSNARADAGIGAAAGLGGAALLGGGALALKKLMAKKSGGQRLVAAMKKNRAALIGGGAAAGGLAGLAAYRKNQGK
jgi:hypothetical protein